MIRKGATTIWELWNGDTADPAMNSRNHVMLLGDLIIWFYEDLAGIRPDPSCPAFRHFELSPVFPEGLEHVRASYDSPYGVIISDWTVSAEGGLSWKVSIPANTTATVKIPARFSSTGSDEVIELGSGQYSL